MDTGYAFPPFNEPKNNATVSCNLESNYSDKFRIIVSLREKSKIGRLLSCHVITFVCSTQIVLRDLFDNRRLNQ